MILRKILWLLFALLATVIGLYPVLYFINGSDFQLLASKDAVLVKSMLWHTAFYTHISMAGAALLTGWLQFSKAIRRKRPGLHRKAGIAYTILAASGAAAGIYLSFFASGGIIPAAGFFVLGIIWLYSTITGFIAIKKGSVSRHEALMVYSYACCFAAVTLRLWLPVLLKFQDFIVAYSIVAWLCWVPNVVVAYFINARSKNKAVS